ncbi:HupE/UreJ family protein [Asanoa iriomotensis]|uniref:HupE/UreJ protein n=1 Tax=Asanoa iriomotensis TaxID=234613 RepID=A0ABQ4BYW6_9ACTN|nr:HupE/UreJ family protein [Asanoa iriomotensis]GIF55702.1 hypothetical protein Air01nite_17970 [Asanoa iriomotensis]
MASIHGGRPARATGLVLVTAACIVAATPAAAWAHGVSGHADSAGAFLGLGFRHMLLGWDHLLFIAGVVLLLAPEIERAMITLSLFALGHSATLIAGTLAGWRFDPVLVDVAIALSLAYIGLVGWFGPPARWRLFNAAVLAVGLVHGLGLATRLQDPQFTGHLTLWRVLAFNAGVELAQLFGGGIIVLIGLAAKESLKDRLSSATTWRLAHGGLIVVGLGASALLLTTAASGGSTALTLP